MRKTIIAGLMAATLVPALAQAQNPELRDDRRDVRHEQREFRNDYRDGAGPGELRADRRDMRDTRREYRADWQDYRRRNPDAFRGPAWVGPRGYAYRPVGVGYRFRPEYYDQRYWIDPYRFHLRPVAGGMRWVRYGPDVLLVDTRSGRVIEVNRGFFF